MRFKDLGKTLLAIAGALGGSYAVSQTVTVAPAFAQEAQEETLQVRIERLMQRPSVDAILDEEFQAGTIQQVTYDAEARRTNFRELVYQENIAPEQRLPVLMFVDNGCARVATSPGEIATKRLAIIFKELRKMYDVDKLSFVCYDSEVDPDSITERPQTRINVGPELYHEGLRFMPSLFLYSYFDLKMGESPQNNNSQIKLIDIFEGAPDANNFIPAVLDNNRAWWIDQWCFGLNNPDGDHKVYQYEKTYELHEVEIPEIARRALARN